MPFMMMWMPYHFWNAVFAWQRMIADLMNHTMVNPREPKAIIADSQASPIDAPASNLVVEIAAEAKERPIEQPHAKSAKQLPSRGRSSKKLKRSKKNGSAKMANSKERRASAARA